jgi:hypothetical protein
MGRGSAHERGLDYRFRGNDGLCAAAFGWGYPLLLRVQRTAVAPVRRRECMLDAFTKAPSHPASAGMTAIDSRPCPRNEGLCGNDDNQGFLGACAKSSPSAPNSTNS